MSVTNPIDALYVHERFKHGSREKEIAEFEDHARRVRAVQQTLAGMHSPGMPQRVFHAKAHACLAGTLHLLDDRPSATRHGIFGPGGKPSYNVLARFSSGVGFDQHDLKPDVRGVALKIFAVGAAAGATDDARRTQDFLMTNSTNPFGNDQQQFVEFMEANLEPVRLAGFLLAHPRIAQLLARATSRILIPSLATERYWSGHPYLLGPTQAMKFNLRPADSSDGEPAEAQVSRLDRDYLRQELRARLAQAPIRFVFSIQLEKDPETTPIEDALIEWKESDSPSIPVAELVLDREVDAQICRKLRFTPGNFVPDHRPLGNMGRGRIFSYAASQMGRQADADAPPEAQLFGGKTA